MANKREKLKEKETQTLPVNWKNMDHEVDSDTNYSWSSWNNPEEAVKETGWTRIPETIQTTVVLGLNGILKKRPDLE